MHSQRTPREHASTGARALLARLEDRLDVVLKTHVEHLVRLIEHSLSTSARIQCIGELPNRSEVSEREEAKLRGRKHRVVLSTHHLKL